MLVLACGAIAREVLAVIELNGWTHVDVRCLPAKLHSTPERIPAAVDAKLTELEGRYERVFVAYADCGTGGALDPVLDATRRRAAAGRALLRLPRRQRRAGTRCRSRSPRPSTSPTSSPGTSTPSSSGRSSSTRIPELLPMVFGNYKRLVYLAQTDDPGLDRRAEARPRSSALAFERRRTGYGELVPSLDAVRRGGVAVPELTVIWWRDIPAQVTAQGGPRARRGCSSPERSRRRSTRPRCAPG